MNVFHYLHMTTQMSPEDDRQVARIAPGNPPCSLVYEIIMTVSVTQRGMKIVLLTFALPSL
jgi:hypothetical protein